MTEQIGKVTLDYTFYNGQDQYSDGDIENDLLQLIMEEPDVEKILAEDDRWPVLYHFSPVRQNILEWYPFKKDASVLEIGAGCGAISGVLCRNAKHVTSVDLSKRRSLINANRNKEYDNLTIMVGNFNDVVLKEKYDYITLIGVLEYAGYYTDDEHPFEAFLKKISGYLKEDGKLLIAIENKFGLKYWAGSREDHTGKFFDGLEDIEQDEYLKAFEVLPIRQHVRLSSATRRSTTSRAHGHTWLSYITMRVTCRLTITTSSLSAQLRWASTTARVLTCLEPAWTEVDTSQARCTGHVSGTR